MQNASCDQQLTERRQKFAPREVRSADEMWQLFSTDESFKPYKVSRAGSDMIWAVHEVYLRYRQTVDQAYKMYAAQWKTSGFSMKDKVFTYHIMQTMAGRQGMEVELLKDADGYKNQKFFLWFFVAFGRNPAKPGRGTKIRPVVKCQPVQTCETQCQTTPRRRGRPKGRKSDPQQLAVRRELFRRRETLATPLLIQLAASKKCYWAEKVLRARLTKMTDAALVESLIKS